MTRVKKQCTVCDKILVAKKRAPNLAYKCAGCGKVLCGKHIYSYVDGNNASITRYSLEYCLDCYRVKYPRDVFTLPAWTGGIL